MSNFIFNNKYQQTIGKSIELQGIGLHSGCAVTLVMNPQPVNTGVLFVRSDINSEDNVIPCHWAAVTNTAFCTTITNEAGVSIHTTEHCMAALAAMGINNVEIRVNGPEVPIMDGSANEFIAAILKAGIKTQRARQNMIKVQRSLRVGNDNAWAAFAPADRFTADFYFDFGASALTELPPQRFSFDGRNFASEIARARTIGFLEHQAVLQSKNLILGASLENTLVFSGNEVLNPEGMRYADECVRHKILDAVGDLYLAGAPIIGRFTGYRSGHGLNNQLLQQLLSDHDNYIICQPENVISKVNQLESEHYLDQNTIK